MRRGKRIGLAVGALVYAVLFGELFLRLVAPVPLMPRYVTAAPYGVRVNMPNAAYWQTTPEVRVQVRTNAKGIRADRDYPYAKPADRCRVVVLGDSFFMGYEVDLERSFAYLLERSLNERGYTCDVVNLAVSGFGTAEMVRTLVADGLRYAPDLVIFQWHQSDLADNLRARLYTVEDGRLAPLADQYLPAVGTRDWLMRFGAYRWLIENSQLYSAVRETAARHVKQALVLLAKLRGTGDKPADGGATAETTLAELLLLEGQRIATENGARFAVVDIPTRVSRQEFETTLDRLSLDVRGELSVVTPLHAFAAHAGPKTKLYFEQGHGHLTELGNRILTDVVVETLVNDGLLSHVYRRNMAAGG